MIDEKQKELIETAEKNIELMKEMKEVLEDINEITKKLDKEEGE